MRNMTTSPVRSATLKVGEHDTQNPQVVDVLRHRLAWRLPSYPAGVQDEAHIVGDGVGRDWHRLGTRWNVEREKLMDCLACFILGVLACRYRNQLWQASAWLGERMRWSRRLRERAIMADRAAWIEAQRREQ
jgi:hypothetical protein